MDHHMHTKAQQLVYTFNISFIILIFLSLTSCSSSYQRRWELQENTTRTPKFNSGRLILPPDSDCSNLELEITRTCSGTRFYVNLLSLQAPPLKDNPSHTRLQIVFEEQSPWEIDPFLLNGGQRLLLPADVADTLVNALFQERSFTISIGRSNITVIPNQFCEEYNKFISLPI